MEELEKLKALNKELIAELKMARYYIYSDAFVNAFEKLEDDVKAREIALKRVEKIDIILKKAE